MFIGFCKAYNPLKKNYIGKLWLSEATQFLSCLFIFANIRLDAFSGKIKFLAKIMLLQENKTFAFSPHYISLSDIWNADTK